VRINRPVAIGAVTAMMALALPLLALPASAATSPPPWEPDLQALGTLNFYNSAGQQVFGGSSLTHLFDYAEASSADTTGGIKATLTFGAPVPGVPTGSWFTLVGSAATNFPNASAPAPLNSSPNPLVSLGATDGNVADLIAQVPAQTMAGYANVFQLRVSTSGLPGHGTGTSAYWDADISVDTTAGTWTEVYPTSGPSAVATTTTLAASPSPSAQQNSPVTLTATVTATDTTHPAGTVEFDQDGFSVGTGAVDTTTGAASVTTSTLLASAPGGTELTAKFTPADSASYSGSSSLPLSYTVNPVAAVPAIAGAHQAGQKESCGVGPLDFGVKASFAWLADGKSIGTGTVTSTTTSHSSSITVPGSAYKQALACRLSVSDGTGPSSTATSTSVTVSLGKALKDSKKPSLSGPHKVGKFEAVKAGTWPRGVKFTYQWLLNGKVIKHATKSSLKLSRADMGKKISCRVTAHLAGFANGVATTSGVKVS
jgi:hypothetical protein